jgi:His/Glu/Gln/Arg/opine family amino acid ABC transporter permease subunit
MEAAIADPRPKRFARWRAESTALSLGCAVVGGAALTAVVAGTIGLVWVRDPTPVPSIVATLKSSGLRGLLVAAVATGGVAVVVGWGTYRRMATRLAREQAIAGAVLGLQVLVFGGALLWFTSGDVQKFAENFLDFEVLGPHIDGFVQGAKNTLILALGGEGLGIVLGLILALFVISDRAVVRAPARVYINIFRATPLIWQISFIYFGLSIGLDLNLPAYAAVILALGLNTGAYAAEVFRAGIQSIERGQIEAARGLGMSYLQAMRYAVIPQAVRRVIPPLMNEFVILIKDTSLVFVVGLAAVERELFKYGRDQFADSINSTFFVGIAIGYLVICIPLIWLVTALERRLRSGLVGVVGQTTGEA